MAFLLFNFIHFINKKQPLHTADFQDGITIKILYRIIEVHQLHARGPLYPNSPHLLELLEYIIQHACR